MRTGQFLEAGRISLQLADEKARVARGKPHRQIVLRIGSNQDMGRFHHRRGGKTLGMAIIIATAGCLVRVGNADFAHEQGVDQRILARQRLPLRIARIASVDPQPLGFSQQQLAHCQGLGRRRPRRLGAGCGMILRFSGNRREGDFMSADEHRFGVHAASFLDRTT
jgi:hypothetical protein